MDERLKILYKKLYELPLPELPKEDYLNDFWTQVELSEADVIGLLQPYIKSGIKKWDNEILKFSKNKLVNTHKKAKKSKDKKTLHNLEIHMKIILQAIELMKKLKC